MPQLHLHTTSLTGLFARVILPLATPKAFTYVIPPELQTEALPGKRVEVQVGKNKRYSGLILEVTDEVPATYKPKPILSVIDAHPIVTVLQLQFWQWISRYYACTLGEVMIAALPARFKLASETRLVLSPLFDDTIDGLRDKEYLITQALENNGELTIDQLRKLLKQQSVYPLIHSLLEKKAIYLREEIKEQYKPKKIGCVRLQEPYASQPGLLEEAFALLDRAPRQMEAMLSFIQLSQTKPFVKKQDIYQHASVDISVLRALEKKGILEIYERHISRLDAYDKEVQAIPHLAPQQTRALQEIHKAFAQDKVVLLHGVTGSGKTRVYIELIQEALRRNEQVLYLLPEIALTAQLTERLQAVFGDAIAVYHSRISDNERIELWRACMAGKPILMSARSGLFLPFQKLKLIIVDEEHDTSFKQHDPAPRYHARDAAIYLARKCGAQVILGTATPSLESYQNARSGKYALVEMPERFGGIELPEMVVVDKKEALKRKQMQSHFTDALLDELKLTLDNGKQAILFQNRRGYAPSIHCLVCGWHLECINCDVSMTYHKQREQMRCHYCSHVSAVPESCPSCGSGGLQLRGFGTEKLEDELKIYFPQARIGRMDLDTVRGKNAYGRLIHDFAEGRIDILVGTQMVTKGLDFDNVAVVGILSADQLLQFPDFRATERAFQLMVQVAGRAGRKQQRGKVLIQAFATDQPVLQEVLDNNYSGFFQREIRERREFDYPPFIRLINIMLKHKNPDTLNEATTAYYQYIFPHLGHYLLGPSVPMIPRVRGQFRVQFMIKLPNRPMLLAKVKQILQQASIHLQGIKGCSGVRVNVDVDPV